MSASRRARFLVCRESTSSRVMPDGSAVVVGSDRQRARNPAAHSPVDTRTVPVNTGEAAARRRSSVSTASSTLSAAGISCSPAALRRNPSGKRSNKVVPPKVDSNAANRRAMVGWLSPSARPAARIEPCRATARNTRTSSQSIAPRVAGSCRVLPPAITDSSRVAMTCSFLASLTVSTSAVIRTINRVPRKRCRGPQKRRSPPLNRGPMLGLAGKSGTPTELVEDGMPSIIDLNAEAAKLTMFRGLTPQTTRAERKGSAAQLPRYRDGLLLLGKSAGTGHWETHPEDELVHVLDGAATLDIVQKDGPQSFTLRAGMIAIVPQSAWHRFHSADGRTTMSATIPGDHIDLDVDDPRTSTPRLDIGDTMRPPSIIDLNAELAKLTMLSGRTPQSTMADRKCSGVRLASYREGSLFATKFAGKGHWESHPTGEELVHVLDGAGTLEIVSEDGSQFFVLRAGMIAVVPQG